MELVEFEFLIGNVILALILIPLEIWAYKKYPVVIFRGDNTIVVSSFISLRGYGPYVDYDFVKNEKGKYVLKSRRSDIVIGLLISLVFLFPAVLIIGMSTNTGYMSKEMIKINVMLTIGACEFILLPAWHLNRHWIVALIAFRRYVLRNIKGKK